MLKFINDYLTKRKKEKETQNRLTKIRNSTKGYERLVRYHKPCIKKYFPIKGDMQNFFLDIIDALEENYNEQT